MDKANETQIPIETGQNNLKTFNKVSNSVNIKHTNCFYCNNPFTEELWCKECDPRRMIEGGFAKVYSATWIDGIAEYNFDWKKKEPQPIKVALKRLNGSENMSAEYLNELKIHWNCYKYASATSLEFYGMTKDPKTEEFMMILQFVDEGNLRSFLSHNFNNILWKDKIKYLDWLIFGKEIKAMFEEADKEIPNISTSYEKSPDAIYTSRLFTFNNLTKPINSSLITSYLDDEKNNKDGQDSQLFDLEVTSSLQSKDDNSDD
ncbi:kinase-like domain-containing protein [Rhizophagus irregularis DAOM 181602=DAOM 197198]|nr:kinase-like domain-containing protein [Rhizophagus irregularis DAOM 181602=DAOM 197198]